MMLFDDWSLMLEKKENEGQDRQMDFFCLYKFLGNHCLHAAGCENRESFPSFASKSNPELRFLNISNPWESILDPC